ncbi:MAG: rod shape-determining protein MreD [Acidimicrobiales bacterium]
MTPLHVAARWSLVILVAFVLQIALVTQIKVFGVTPDIMVVLAVCAGLSGGAQRGAVVGFWLGLAFDLPRTEHPLGISALAYCLVAFVAGIAQVVVLQSGRIMSMAIVAVASLLGVLLFAVEGQFFGGDTLANPHLATILGVSALVGALLSRIGLRVAGWADGPETRSAAE